MPKTITLNQLRAAGACHPQLELFEQTFGQSVDVTAAVCAQYANVFDWDWAASDLLSESALEAYYEAVSPAREAYYKVVSPARAAYYEAISPARAAYYEVGSPAREAYYKVVSPAREAYDEVLAASFAAAYTSEA